MSTKRMTGFTHVYLQLSVIIREALSARQDLLTSIYQLSVITC